MSFLKNYPIRDETGISFVPVPEIVWVEASGQYIVLHLADGREIMQTRRLGYHMAQLQQTGVFCRIHRSHAVNIAFVDKIGRDRTVYLKNGTQLLATRGSIPQLVAMISRR